MRPELLVPRGGVEDEQIVSDILMLANVKDVPLADIHVWTTLERILATNWALRVHLSASDNLNRVPDIPHFLWRYQGAAFYIHTADKA